MTVLPIHDFDSMAYMYAMNEVKRSATSDKTMLTTIKMTDIDNILSKIQSLKKFYYYQKQ